MPRDIPRDSSRGNRFQIGIQAPHLKVIPVSAPAIVPTTNEAGVLINDFQTIPNLFTPLYLSLRATELDT